MYKYSCIYINVCTIYIKYVKYTAPYMYKCYTNTVLVIAQQVSRMCLNLCK